MSSNLMDFAMLIAALEEQWEKQQTTIKKESKLKTKIIDKNNIQISSQYLIYSLNKPGVLREFFLSANSPNFNLDLTIDEYTVSRNFNNLLTLSSYVNFIDAFQDNQKYIIHLGQLNWREKFKLSITPLNSITIYNLLCIIDE